MVKKEWIGGIIFCIICIQIVLAGTLPPPDRLCTKEIKFMSEKFSFMNGISSGQTSTYDEKYYFLEDTCNRNPLHYFQRPYQFYYSDNATRIKVFINNEKLLDTELSPLNVKMFTEGLNYNEWPNVAVYECPGYVDCPIKGMSKNLKDYDKSIIKVYVDDDLVREYLMEFSPSPYQTNECSEISQNKYIIIIIVISLVVIIIIFFVLYKKFKK